MTREEAMESIMTREEAIEIIKRNCASDSDLQKACVLFIPELCENEDERTRKGLVNFLQSPFIKENLTDEKVAPWIAYLEKQGEQKPRKFKLGDKVRWYDDDTNVITITGFRDDAYLTDSVYGPILFCDEDNWERIEQKSAEWSEVDEEMIGNIISSLRGYIYYVRENGNYNNHEAYIQKEIEFLNSLRPQPKQDVLPSLSEKEIICLKRALDYLRKEHNRYGGEDFTNEIAVLEWLITHPILVSDTHWKPSEEQMKQLYYAITPGSTFDCNILYELYRQLKKLM